jgi:ribosomal protein S18 acetylase RimI-like enzyme
MGSPGKWILAYDLWASNVVRAHPIRQAAKLRHESTVAMSETIGINIRAATGADLQSIGRLGALLVRTHHDFDPQRFISATPQTEHGYASFLGSQLGERSVMILVADQGNEVVGYTYAGVESYDYMSLRGPAGVLYDIVVDPAHRGQGIGQMLLGATLAILADRGAPRVVLSTAERNAAAQRLFERAGFRRTMIEMTRELDGDPR